jgi:hypothetical protein
MFTQAFHHIHPPLTISLLITPHTGTNPSGKTCFTLLFSGFYKKKRRKMTFLVVKIATWGISLWNLHVFIYIL